MLAWWLRMSDLGWRADGLARARAAGGLDAEKYLRPGFVGGSAVRWIRHTEGGEGFEVESDPEFALYDRKERNA